MDGNGDRYTPISAWKTSSYSASNGHCIETAPLVNGQVGVQDKKMQGKGPMLRFTSAAWNSFTSTVRAM
ncbi:MAG TPA: DUF397 domain-containing protein [Trebonia sp.]|nr:DUF397 domain-containing protein [Trebonia sp.]